MVFIQKFHLHPMAVSIKKTENELQYYLLVWSVAAQILIVTAEIVTDNILII